MQSLDTDIQSLGGGGMGGFGGGGYNPLLWLITLGFLGGRNGLLGGGNEAGAGVIAGENSAKLDCLAQGQNSLQSQIIEQGQDVRFQNLNLAFTDGFRNLNDNLNNLAGIQRDTSDTIFRQTTLLSQQNAAENAAMQRQLADCCCDLKAGQQATQTAIAMQTNELNTVATANTQRIIDAINDQTVESLKSQLAERTSQLNIAETVKQVSENCGCCNGSQNGGGNSIDINVILAALLRNQGAAFAPGNSSNVPAV